MEQKILGIDLGTSSLGIAVRNVDLGRNISEQLEYYGSIIFKSGVGNGKSGEYSFAAERTKYRSTRRLYQSRKYRIWATLKLLIAYGCCPLKSEDLDKWSKYDKGNNLKRRYPVDAKEFEQWVRLDFNCDGIPEYSSPYQLRAELMKHKLDWDNQTDRFKFGRAMYHIAQRRGFKSSKGETLKEAGEKDDIVSIDIKSEMKKSEESKSRMLKEYMANNHLETVGCAFARLEKEGIRIRNSEYQAVQSLYIDEINKICIFQQIDKKLPQLFNCLISTKKGEGTIFYRRPLRTQKHNVGKCTLEPTRDRVSVSNPEYEEFRALSFINNIRYRASSDDDWSSLDNEQRNRLFDSVFTRSKATFKFEDIRKWLEKEHKNQHFSYEEHTINYRDTTSVAGCPVISRLKKILGEDWRNASLDTNRNRINNITGEIHKVSYNYEDVWHLAYTSEDYEELAEFASKRMHLDDKQVDELTRLWSVVQDGYTSLSLKAVRNITPFLREGMVYSDAVALAKIPDIIGFKRWEENKADILLNYKQIQLDYNYLRMVYRVTNTLISNYKSKVLDERQAFKNTQYKIDDIDRKEVMKCIIESISKKRWMELQANEQNRLRESVEFLYQQFFSSSKREYFKIPLVSDGLKRYLYIKFPDVQQEKWDKLYHHSQINKFTLQSPQQLLCDGHMMYVFQLGTPNIGAIKNPVALRALYILRNTINELLAKGIIDENTRVVVETARDMNDANWRWAIENYQKARNEENRAIAEVIKEFRPQYNDADIAKGRLLFEQNIVELDSPRQKTKAERFTIDFQKYKLWQEQRFICIYSGKTINMSDLFDDNIIQIEHTIPRSISFDDSLSNKTVCFTHANREKNNRIPAELSNYADIQDRIQHWKEKVEHIKSQIEIWKGKSRIATTVDRKNQCIRQKHLYELELDYWQAKLQTFTVQKDELEFGFRHRQLVDTRIITKYAYHYLKSVFSRVDVQKGSVTAGFRKILGIQSADEKKNRNKHSHHAVDAAVLTMIPVASQRDRMIELFYRYEEACDGEKNTLRLLMDKEIQSCRLGTINNIVDIIENNILVNHIYKDQTLSVAKKTRFVCGKRIVGQWNKGDSIRGSLHKDTFYGAIKTSDDEYLMVVRKPLKSLTEKDLDCIVDAKLKKCIEKQIYDYIEKEQLSFAKAIEKDIYMLSKDGQQIKRDKNGRPISPIRHVRCKAKAGRGLLKIDTTIKIKQQTYKSKKCYKNNYYVQNDDNYLCLYYEGTLQGKYKRCFRLINYFDVAQLNINSTDSLYEEPEFKFFEGNKMMPLKAIIKKGTRVIPYIHYPEEVKEMDSDRLNKRLFVVYKFNEMGTPNIYLVNHIESRKENDCDSSERATEFSTQANISYLSLKADKFKALIENVDFEIDPIGNIVFK